DFARPQPAGVDDVLGVHVTVVGNHIPGTIRSLLEIDNSRVTHNLCATDLRRLCVCVSNTVWVDVALDRIVDGTQEVLLVHERKQLRGFICRDDLEVHAKIAAAGLGHLEPVHPLGRTGQHDTARDVHSAGLAGYPLELLVQIDGVLLQLGDIRIAVDSVHATGCVPRGARRQFVTFYQENVAPTRLGQVIQNTGAHDASAYHHDSGSTLHIFT